MNERTNSVLRVAVVEDRSDDRNRLVALLNETPGFVCIQTCSTGEEALQMLPESKPDIVLMDIQMPGKSGIDCVRELAEKLPAAQFMMVTVVEDHDLIFRALEAGATGYLLKKTPGPRLLEAVRELRDGGAPMSGQVARKVVAAFRKPAPVPSGESTLSPTQRKVLELMARGLLYKEVAEELGMSLSTVRTHVWHIYRKLQAHNRTEAILKARSRGNN